MSRFSFRLQRVLDLREQLEQARAATLAAATREAAAAESAHAEVQAMRAAGSEALSAATRDGASVGSVHQLQFLVGALESRAEATRQGLVTAESLMRRAQDDLRAAHADRRALEVLRERQATAHRAATQAAEQTLMDDIALSRFNAAATDPTTEDTPFHG